MEGEALYPEGQPTSVFCGRRLKNFVDTGLVKEERRKRKTTTELGGKKIKI